LPETLSITGMSYSDYATEVNSGAPAA